MGYILFILCILFCIGLVIFILSNDSKNIIVDEDGSIKITKNKYGMIEQESQAPAEPEFEPAALNDVDAENKD